MKGQRENTQQLTLCRDKHIDRLFSDVNYPGPFKFTDEVAAVFDDMASRSIPMYGENLQLTSKWVREVLPPSGGRIFDIGCSTGTTLFQIGRDHPFPLTLYGIDTSPAMIQRAELKLSSLKSMHTIFLEVNDAQSMSFKDADSVVLNYTLQFLPVNDRLDLLKNIYSSLKPGGMMIVADKLFSQSAPIHEIWTKFYEEFKMLQGYSRTEIERKKEALERVLIPLTYNQELELFRNAGFTDIECILRWQQFATFACLKNRA